MNCWRVQNLIAPFLDDELPDAESESLAGHLDQCPPCRDLVEGVAALPDFPKFELVSEMATGLWSEFDRCLDARLEASRAEPDIPLVPERSTELRVHRNLVVAAAAVLVLLAGWNWMTQQRLERLEASLGERDAMILALQERVATTQSRDTGLALSGETPLPVLLPATAPGATVIGSTRVPTHFRPASYQAAAGPNPTLIR